MLFRSLEQTDTQLRLFGKPEIDGRRRLGVALARGSSIDNAIEKALHCASVVKVML